MDLIVGLKNLEGMPLGNTTNTIIWCSYIPSLDIYKWLNIIEWNFHSVIVAVTYKEKIFEGGTVPP